MSYDEYVPDLILAADVVLGKLGYGFVSECVSGNTALVYVPRVDWPEQRYLEALLCDTYDAGVLMPMEDFVSGNWDTFLSRALAKKGTWTVDPAQTGPRAVQTVVELIQSVLIQ
jgi:hypothetical protein